MSDHVNLSLLAGALLGEWDEEIMREWQEEEKSKGKNRKE